VKAIQASVLNGAADVAVHSAKDLPSRPTDGLTVAAYLERADPCDALVGTPLDEMPPGAVVATGSIRRRAQLAWLRPDLGFVELRGNIHSRLAVLKPGWSLVMAVAALDRLGLSERISQRLEPAWMVPQAGQGALALECRSDDARTRSILGALDHKPTRLAVETERAFLARLGAGCSAPVGAYAAVEVDQITARCFLGSLDGSVALRLVRSGTDPLDLGGGLAEELLDRYGGRELMGAWSAVDL
jgi:hydroxymethylbilane synthase